VLEFAAARRLTECHLQNGQEIVDGIAGHRSHWCRIEANPVAHFFVSGYGATCRLCASAFTSVCMSLDTSAPTSPSTGAGPQRRPRRRASQARTTISVDTRRDAERGGGSRRPCVTTWPPSAPREASTDRAPAARRVARRPEGRAATADARAAREAVGQAAEPDKMGCDALRASEMAVGPPLLGRNGEERAGSGSLSRLRSTRLAASADRPAPETGTIPARSPHATENSGACLRKMTAGWSVFTAIV
jgi:hypothetical protein